MIAWIVTQFVSIANSSIFRINLLHCIFVSVCLFSLSIRVWEWIMCDSCQFYLLTNAHFVHFRLVYYVNTLNDCIFVGFFVASIVVLFFSSVSFCLRISVKSRKHCFEYLCSCFLMCVFGFNKMASLNVKNRLLYDALAFSSACLVSLSVSPSSFFRSNMWEKADVWLSCDCLQFSSSLIP